MQINLFILGFVCIVFFDLILIRVLASEVDSVITCIWSRWAIALRDNCSNRCTQNIQNTENAADQEATESLHVLRIVKRISIRIMIRKNIKKIEIQEIGRNTVLDTDQDRNPTRSRKEKSKDNTRILALRIVNPWTLKNAELWSTSGIRISRMKIEKKNK